MRNKSLEDIQINYTQKELIDFGYRVASGKILKEEIKKWIQLHK